MAYNNYGPPPGAPPQGYGAPPYPPQGQGGYGAPSGPPPQGYGGYGGGGGGGGYAPPSGPPPPGQGYGGGYGGYAPPPGPPQGAGGYGPPGGAAGAYGAPPGAPPPMHQGGAPGAGALTYLYTQVPPPPPNPPAAPPAGYDPYRDVERLRKAMKGFGTDEKAVIETLAPLDAFQIDSLGHAFKATVGKSLLASIEGETSGWFEGALRAKILGPVGYDVWLVHRACNGAGTNEDILNEVLIGRSNSEMWALKQAFRATYHKDMEKVVEDDLSMKTKRMFVMVMQAARQEEWVPVDPGLVQQDVKDLKNAARGAGTDEIKICGILLSRSNNHLRAVAHAYSSKPDGLSSMVKSEFSGHMEGALLHAVRAVEGNAPYGISQTAALLEASMKGLGTQDEKLVYRTLRAHWDRRRFEDIKAEYARTQHKKGLRNRVEGETSGDYKRFLVAVIGH